MRAPHGRAGRLRRIRSLPRGVVWVICGALLTLTQTALELGGAGRGTRLLVAAVVAGLAVTSEVDRHRHETPGETMASAVPPDERAADRLAAVVGGFWAAEATRRGLTSPAPVPVRWHWAAADVAVPTSDVASAGAAGLGPGPLGGRGARDEDTGPVLRSGVVTRLHDEVYARLAFGRLAVLGAPGAGKTASMILLLLQALEHRATAAPADRALIPVPVWLTLGGWDPAAQSLREWALAVLHREHPYLRAPAFGPDAAATLLDSGRLALFLDGLDEMAPDAQGLALRRIDAETARCRVVLSSRPAEYTRALDSGRWHNAAVIELRSVRPAGVATFLERGHVGRRREAWAAVAQYVRLNPDSVPARVLTTPLMLSLARTAYATSDPTELTAAERFGSTAVLREHLLDCALVAAYPDAAERAHAIRWLSWAAHRLASERDLGWWDIPSWVPRWRVQVPMVASAVLVGLITASVGAVLLEVFFTPEAVVEGGRVVGTTGTALPGKHVVQDVMVQLAVVGALVVWWGSEVVRRRSVRRSRPIRLRPRRPSPAERRWVISTACLSAIGVGLGVGLLSGFGSVIWTSLDLAVTDGLGADVVDSRALSEALGVVVAVGLSVGIPVGLVVGLFGVWSAPDEHAPPTSPWRTYTDDRRARTTMSLVCGGAVGLSVALAAWALLGPAPALVYGTMAGLVTALLGRVLFGLASALRFAESALRAPRLVPLLEDALGREVLRQAGAVYQFRHADLQDHLARAFEQHEVQSGTPGRFGALAGRLSPLARRWRRRTAAGCTALALAAAAVVLAAPISGMLDPDHATLTDTPSESLAFSADGACLVSSGDGQTVVWDVAAERKVQTLPGRIVGAGTTPVRLAADADDPAISPDGSKVATSWGPEVRWWSVETGEVVGGMRVGSDLEILGFSPDRTTIAALDAAAGTVSLWDVATGQSAGTLQAWRRADLAGGTAGLIFSPDSELIATWSGERAVTRIWGASTATLLRSTPASSFDGPAFSRDGRILAVPDGRGVTLYDASTPALRRIGSVDEGGAVSFGADGILATGYAGAGGPDALINEGGHLRLWDRRGEHLMRTLDAGTDHLLTEFTTFNPHGAQVATVWAESLWNLDAHVLVWDVGGDAGPQTLGRGNRALLSLAFSPDGGALATGWEDGRVRIWRTTP